MKIKIFILALLSALSMQAASQIEFTKKVLPEGFIGPVYKCDSQYAFALLNGPKDHGWPSLSLYSENGVILKTIQFEGFTIDALYSYFMYNSEHYDFNPTNLILASQYLFNDDDLFEVVTRENHYDEDGYGYSIYRIFNEKGEDLSGPLESIDFLILNGTVYFGQPGSPYMSSSDYYDEEKYPILYTFNQNFNNGSNPGTNRPGGGSAEALLNIYGNETYVLDMAYPEGTSAKIEIEPQEGWSIYSVIFNEEDITDKLEENVLETEPLYGENTLEIIMVDNAGILMKKADDHNKIEIRKETDGIFIGSMDDNEILSLYDLQGHLIYTGTNKYIPLGEKGIYILHSPYGNLKFAF